MRTTTVLISLCLLLPPVFLAAPALAPRIPARHPYLVLTPQEIAKARQAAAGSDWARRISGRIREEADRNIALRWGKLPGKGDTEHRSIGNRLFQTALGYALTGDTRYAEWVRDGLLAYAAIYPSLPSTRGRSKLFTQSSLFEATWLVVVVQAYDLVAETLTPAQREVVERDLLRAAVACFKIDDFQNDPRIRDLHYRCYNFQAWHLSAIGLVGLAVRDASLADYAVNSRYGLRHLIAHDIRDDGMFWERSASYHQFVISALLPFTEAMARCGVDLYALSVPNDRSGDEDAHYVTDTSGKPKSLKLLFEAPFYLAFPDLGYPALGDSNRGPLRGTASQLVGWHRYRDPRLAWLVAREPESSRDWRWLAYDSPSAPSSLPLGGGFGATGRHVNGCSLFPSTGVAILRQTGQDFTAQPDATAASLSYGPYGGGHGHPDKLNLVVYAQGRQWLPDFGSMTYETRWKAEWTAHTVSHNTLVVDGVSQRPAGTRNTQWPVDTARERVLGTLERFDPKARLAAAFCDSAYQGVRLRRAVRLVRDCVVDDFAADSAAEHQYDHVLHIDGELENSSIETGARSGKLGERCGYQHVDQQRAGTATGPASFTFRAGDRRLRVWVLAAPDAPVEAILAQGLTNTPEGRMTMLVLRRKAAKARFLTVFEPVGSQPLRAVRAAGDAIALDWPGAGEKIRLR